MADLFCPQCERLTEVVVDHSAAGETSTSISTASITTWSCSGCGLLLHSLPSAVADEFRYSAFNSARDNDGGGAADDGDDEDENTPASASDSGGDEPRSNDDAADDSTSSLPHGLSSKLPRTRLRAVKSIAAMADRLHLAESTKERACKIYAKVEDQKPRGRNQAALIAATLYIACRQENKPCTVKEIASIVTGASRKKILRAKDYIVRHIELESGQCIEMGTIHATDFVRRFCSTLGMKGQESKAAQEAVLKCEELDVRRSPLSLAASVIYMISQFSTNRKCFKEVSTATGVAEGTIKSSYRDLYPLASQLIPSWLVKNEKVYDYLTPIRLSCITFL